MFNRNLFARLSVAALPIVFLFLSPAASFAQTKLLRFPDIYGDRVAFTYYEAGHMIYIRPSEHKKLKADIARFIQGTRSRT